MAIDNYIDKITKDGESRMISPAADKVRVKNEHYEGDNLDDVLDEIDEKVSQAGTGNYTKPSTGIPKSDMESAVQTSLGKADSAVQDIQINGGLILPKVHNNVDIFVPTKTSQLQNDSGFITEEDVPSGHVDDQMSASSPFPVQNKVIKAYVDNLIAGLIDGAPAALDTLKELATALGNNSDAIAAIVNSLSSKANASEVVKGVSVNGTAQTKDGNGNVAISGLATTEQLTQGLEQKQDTLTFDDVPTSGSVKPVKSGGIKQAIELVTPTIDANGKWVIGGVTTDKDAQGPRGNTILVNENAQGIQALIVNNVVDGGETDILSAEMGKVIRLNIMRIFNALGTYAFPEGKPVLNWGSTVIYHSINVNGVTGGLTITDVEIDGVSAASLPATIVDGKSLSLKLNLPSNLYIYDAVAITMGGVDITDTTGVWDESTGTIYIASVMDDISIIATALTYVGYGESNSPLVLMLDGKNQGETAGQWKNLCNNNKPLVLSGGYTQNDDSVTFNGSDGTGKIDALGIDLPWLGSALESVYKQSDTTPTQVIALSGNTYNTVLCALKNANDIFSNNGTIPDGGSALSGAYTNYFSKNGVMPYGTNTIVHLVNNGGNNHYLNNVALQKDAESGIGSGNYVGVSTSTHNNAGEFWVSGYVGRAGSYFGPLKGSVYAVRAYNRVLTDAELAQNHKVDKKRFNIA